LRVVVLTATVVSLLGCFLALTGLDDIL